MHTWKFIIIACLAASCAREQPELFTIHVIVKDSVLTYADGSVIPVSEWPNINLSSPLSDSMETIARAIADTEQYANVTYPARMVAHVEGNVPWMALGSLGLLAVRQRLNEVRLEFPDTDGRTIQIPIVVPSRTGVHHYIEVTENGLSFSTLESVVAWPQPEQPFDAHRTPYSLEEISNIKDEDEPVREQGKTKSEKAAAAKAAAARRAKAAAIARGSGIAKLLAGNATGYFSSELYGGALHFQRRSPGVLIPRVSDRLDLPTLRRELDRLSEEFHKIGYHGGRHFFLRLSPSLPSSDFLDVARTIIESMPRVLEHASLWDISPPPPAKLPEGYFTYFNGYKATFSEFSMSLPNWNAPALGQSEDSVLSGESRLPLLCPGGLMAAAIRDTNLTLMDALLKEAVDINGYVFKNLAGEDEWHGYTPTLLAVEFQNSESLKHLIRAGADVNKRSRRFPRRQWRRYAETDTLTGDREITALMLAQERKYDEIMQILKDAGAK